MKKLATILVLVSMSVGFHTRAGGSIKKYLSCVDRERGAKLVTYGNSLGELRYRAVFCNDGRQGPNCLVYGDYQKDEAVDVQRNGNRPYRFIQGTVSLLRTHFVYHFRDTEKKVAIAFYDQQCSVN